MIFIIAWRNVWKNWARSTIIITSVALGLFAGIFVLAIYKGMMNSRIQTVIEDEVSHLQIHNPLFKNDYEPVYTLRNSKQLLQKLRAVPGVKEVAERSIVQGMLATGTGSNGVEIKGIIPSKEMIVSRLDKKIISGSFFGTGKKNELLIGKKLADKMKLNLNKKVVLTFTDKDNNVVSAAFRISGIYQTSNSPMDERIVYVKAQELNALLNTGEDYHEFAILLTNDNDVEIVKQQLEKEYPNLLIETWKELSPETELSITTVNQFSIIIIVIIMLALAFGIINTMLMAVLERTHETGIMLALGMNKQKLFLMILLETVFLTTSGVPVGLLLSWLIIVYVGKYGIDISSFAKAAMEQFGYGSIIYPQFPEHQLFTVLLVVIITALISGVFPAFKALSLQPVDALKK